MQFIVGKPLTIDEFKILQWFHCDILYSNIPKIPRIKFLGFVLLFFFFDNNFVLSISHLQTHCSTLNVYFYLLVRTRLIRTILFFIRLFQYASLLSQKAMSHGLLQALFKKDTCVYGMWGRGEEKNISQKYDTEWLIRFLARNYSYF